MAATFFDPKQKNKSEITTVTKSNYSLFKSEQHDFGRMITAEYLDTLLDRTKAEIENYTKTAEMTEKPSSFKI